MAIIVSVPPRHLRLDCFQIRQTYLDSNSNKVKCPQFKYNQANCLDSNTLPWFKYNKYFCNSLMEYDDWDNETFRMTTGDLFILDGWKWINDVRVRVVYCNGCRIARSSATKTLYMQMINLIYCDKAAKICIQTKALELSVWSNKRLKLLNISNLNEIYWAWFKEEFNFKNVWQRISLFYKGCNWS